MRHREDSPPATSPLVAGLRREACSAAGIAVLAAIGLVVCLALVAAARPTAWAAGFGGVAAWVVAAAGTSLSACVALGALAGGYGGAARLSDQGGAGAAEALGLGRWQVFGQLAPVWALLAGLAILAGAELEPRAWAALQGLKGSPAASAAMWGALHSGEVRSVGGGALVLEEGRLRSVSGDGTWRAELGPLSASSTAWGLGGGTIDAGGLGRWTVDSLELRLAADRAQAWTRPPRGPWTLRPGPLLGAVAERGAPRDWLVLHRRLASAPAALLLAALGWSLGWVVGPRARRRPMDALLAAGLVLLVMRGADRAALAGLLPAAVAGWSPLLLTAALLVWVVRR